MVRTLAQTLPPVPVSELRSRLGLGLEDATDVQLQTVLDEAGRIVGHQLPEDCDFSAEPVVADAIASIAVDLWDARPRGLVDVDTDGTLIDMPGQSATAGLVKKVRGLLLPVMPTGGLTV